MTVDTSAAPSDVLESTTPDVMMAVALSRLLRDGETVFH